MSEWVIIFCDFMMTIDVFSACKARSAGSDHNVICRLIFPPKNSILIQFQSIK